MAENVEKIEVDEDLSDEGKARQRSKIAFPYSDYNAAISVADTIHSHVGHGNCATSQLAPWMNQSAKSSGFRLQIAAARLFGLIESKDAESYHLTVLGIKAVDPSQDKLARAEAFLRVPLFNALFEKYKGVTTPPTAALEREIVALGVSEKQKAKARQVFESSAEQTGYREKGSSRLVKPASMVITSPSDETIEKSGGGNGGDGGNLNGLELDPLLIALLQKIPKLGEEWPKEKRVRWFKTFAMNVSQVYDNDDNPVEIEIGTK